MQLKKNQTLTEKVLKGSSIVLIFTFLGSPIGYLIRVLYSYSLSIEMFGLFYAALAFFSLLSTYLDFGLGFSTSYFIPKFLKKKDEKSVANIFQYCQITELFITVSFSIVLFFNAHWLAVSYFKSIEAVNLIYIFSIYLIANSIFTALNTLFLGFQNELYYSSMQFFRLVFILVFSGLFWIFDIHNVVFYASSWAVGTLLVVMCYYLLVFKKYTFVFSGLSWNKGLLKSMISYGVPTLVTASIYTFITSTDTLFLTFFHGLKDVGVYNVVYPLATIPGLFLSPINSLVLPLISHLMEGEEKKVHHLIQSVLKFVPFISLYFGLFIALFPAAIVGSLFGAKWLGLVEEPLMIFALGFVLAPLSTLLVTILSGMGKVKERLRLSVIIAFLNIALSLLLIPKFGVLGAVIANTLVYFISVLLFTRSISQSFSLNYPFKFYGKLLLFVCAIFLTTRLLSISLSGWIQIILAGFIYTVTFVGFAFWQKIIDEKIIEIISEKFTRILQKLSLVYRP